MDNTVQALWEACDQWAFERAEEQMRKQKNLPYESLYFAAVSERIAQCPVDLQSALRRQMLSKLLDFIVFWFDDRYVLDETFANDLDIQLFIQETEKIENSYFHAISAFFQGEYNKCTKLLRKFIAEYDEPMDEEWFALHFLPFKNAYPGFWDAVRDMLKKSGVSPWLVSLCNAAKAYYTSGSSAESADTLCEILCKNPDSPLLNELLGFAYYRSSQWRNAAACFEKTDVPYTCPQADFAFCMGWAYGKTRETLLEIEAYEKCIALDSSVPFALNNLGYAYYKARRYDKALETFAICLEKKLDPEYAVNNYIRTLLAMGQYQKAKQFAKNPPHKIAKNLLEKLNKASNVNAVWEAAEEAEPAIQPSTRIPIKSSVQFSSERLLEEELEERMNKGLPVFGMHLKMYRRKGIYGRQFIIPEGRLDLLAEDAEGNLYVIELKKDSGYDDAYEQTVRYLESPTMQKLAEKKKLLGIICLNDPTEKLISDVKNDPRMRLFEYRISYMEVK